MTHPDGSSPARPTVRSRVIAAASALLVGAGSLFVATPGLAAAQDFSSAPQDAVFNSTEGAMKGGLALGSGDSLATMSSEDIAAVDPTGFYSTLPETVDAAPGDIVKTQPSHYGLGWSVPGWNNSRVTRIAYASEDVNGNIIPVTGHVFTSPVKWTGDGPRPLIVLAPGTHGSGDTCAPGQHIGDSVGETGINVATALNRGWNVALTDLPGLGTPRPHTYMNRVDQAHALLNLARAATNLGKPELASDSPVATWGYSQGGGTSAAALELQPSYAPDVNLVAGVAGGVPADLMATAVHIDGTSLAGALGYTMNGLLHTNPELRPNIEGVLNDKGKRFLRDTADECFEASLLKHGFLDSSTLTTTGETLAEVIQRDDAIRAVINQQKIGTIAPAVPAFITQGTHDDTIPPGQARTMSRSWCDAGASVKYSELNLPRIAPMVDHMTPAFTNMTVEADWLDHGFRTGQFSRSNCEEIPHA